MADKLQSEEYEGCIIGAMLIDNASIDIAEGMLKPEYFYNGTNRMVFSTILEIYGKNKFCDILALSSELQGKVKADVIASYTDKVSTSKNIEFYAGKVRSMALARRLASCCRECADSVDGENLQQKLSELDDSISSMLQNSVSAKRTSSKELVAKFVADIQSRIGVEFNLLGLDTGFPNLNGMLDGMPLGELTVIAARPSIGKTALALNLLTNMAFRGTPSAIFSLEMSNDNLAQRIVSSQTGIRRFELLHGIATKSESSIRKLNNVCDRIYKTDVSFYDSTGCDGTLETISALIRTEAKRGKKCFFIDHLGLVRHSDKSMKRYEQVHDITFSMHKLAQRLNVCIIMLCQLKRDSEGRLPSLADFRESGDIEQDISNAIFIHRERGQGGEASLPAKLIIAKHRNGETGTINMEFIPSLAKFAECRDGKNEQ